MKWILSSSILISGVLSGNITKNFLTCKIKTFESGAAPGDYAQVGISTKRGVYGCELIVAVEKIIPAAEIESNFAR